jgi:NADH-ubiquinone oxidoreductase chain 3
MSIYSNEVYGLVVLLIFILIITVGFVFELGKNALKIDSRQSYDYFYKSKKFVNTFIENK